jgi:glycosyltransferase involved in cell wall biosynthesis
MSNFRGWILDAIPRESAAAINQEVQFSYLPVRRRELVSMNSIRNYFAPRPSKFNLFIHHRSFFFVKERANLLTSRNRIWLTHFDKFSDVEELSSCIEYIDKLFVQNANLALALAEAGFPESKLSIQPGAVNRQLFSPLSYPGIEEGYFLFTGDCKSRKNPLYIQWLIQSFPDVNFVIHGNGWRVYNEGVFLDFSNLKIFDFEYELQPALLRNACALIIVSINEGGPIALLESLSCGTPVISTPAGFAQDILNPDRGVVISLNSSIFEWREFFNQMRALKEKSRYSDLLNDEYTWQALGKHLYQ